MLIIYIYFTFSAGARRSLSFRKENETCQQYKELSVSKAAQTVLPKHENTNSKTVRDVNGTGEFDLNDVQAVWNCYNVNQEKFPMATYMAVYLRADVAGDVEYQVDGKVDSKDISAIFDVFKDSTKLLLAEPQ